LHPCKPEEYPVRESKFFTWTKSERPLQPSEKPSFVRIPSFFYEGSGFTLSKKGSWAKTEQCLVNNLTFDKYSWVDTPTTLYIYLTQDIDDSFTTTFDIQRYDPIEGKDVSTTFSFNANIIKRPPIAYKEVFNFDKSSLVNRELLTTNKVFLNPEVYIYKIYDIFLEEDFVRPVRNYSLYDVIPDYSIFYVNGELEHSLVNYINGKYVSTIEETDASYYFKPITNLHLMDSKRYADYSLLVNQVYKENSNLPYLVQSFDSKLETTFEYLEEEVYFDRSTYSMIYNEAFEEHALEDEAFEDEDLEEYIFEFNIRTHYSTVNFTGSYNLNIAGKDFNTYTLTDCDVQVFEGYGYRVSGGIIGLPKEVFESLFTYYGTYKITIETYGNQQWINVNNLVVLELQVLVKFGSRRWWTDRSGNSHSYCSVSSPTVFQIPNEGVPFSIPTYFNVDSKEQLILNPVYEILPYTLETKDKQSLTNVDIFYFKDSSINYQLILGSIQDEIYYIDDSNLQLVDSIKEHIDKNYDEGIRLSQFTDISFDTPVLTYPLDFFTEAIGRFYKVSYRLLVDDLYSYKENLPIDSYWRELEHNIFTDESSLEVIETTCAGNLKCEKDMLKLYLRWCKERPVHTDYPCNQDILLQFIDNPAFIQEARKLFRKDKVIYN